MHKYLLLFLFTYSIFSFPNQRPIIGIVTQTDEDDIPKSDIFEEQVIQTYITASYVKFVQMSGAQVVPIFAFGKQSDIATLLPKLNGVLFPGGEQQTWDIKNNWVANTNFILQYAIDQNNKGNVFPVWGTCLGLQLLTFLTANYDYKVLTPVQGQARILNTLNFTENSNKGYVYDNMPEQIYTKLTTGEGIVYYNHHWALFRSTYDANLRLRNFWRVVAETTSPFNETFVAVMQAKKFPFYAVQFHPEKSLFEWKVFSEKSYDTVQMVQIMSNRFIEKARQSKSSFNSYEQYQSVSIYNYRTYPTIYSFSRVYLFNETSVGYEGVINKIEKQKTYNQQQMLD